MRETMAFFARNNFITFRFSLISFLEAVILLVSTKDLLQGPPAVPPLKLTWIRATEDLRKEMPHHLINERKNELLYVHVN